MFHVIYYCYPQSFHVTRKRLFWPIFGRFGHLSAILGYILSGFHIVSRHYPMQIRR